MISLIEQHREQIGVICRKHHVVQLAAFGSVVRDDFDPGRSDVDLLVEFAPMEPDEYAEAYFGLLFDLEKLLARPIELITARSIRNPFFREELEQTGQTLYAA